MDRMGLGGNDRKYLCAGVRIQNNYTKLQLVQKTGKSKSDAYRPKKRSIRTLIQTPTAFSYISLSLFYPLLQPDLKRLLLPNQIRLLLRPVQSPDRLNIKGPD